jgi:hypothetical protein
MSSKKEPPIDVTLNESTGTWEMPGRAGGNIKPWQRIWFVAGIVYLLALAGSYFMLAPNQERIERNMVFSVTEEVKRFDGLAFAGESPRVIFETARTEGFVLWIKNVRSRYRIGSEGNAGFDNVDKAYRDALADLPLQRKLGLMICFVAWMMPMSLLYAMGLLLDWVGRRAHSRTVRRG